MMGTISSIEDVKLSNTQIIMNQLRGQTLHSRTQLAQATGLSKATVTRILNDLIKNGLVDEVRTTESAIGRPHILLRLVPRTRCAIGIELTPTSTRSTLTDMNARPLKQRVRPLAVRDVDTLIADLAQEVEELCNDSPAELVGVGVTVPGVVNNQTGLLNLQMADGWQEVPLASLLSGRLSIPVVTLNQTQAAAWGEKWREGRDQVSDLLYVRLGTVAEAGIILDGRLHTGKPFTAGAIGHMNVDPQGEPCTCGSRGCLNTVVSAAALLAAARERLKENSSSMLMGMIEGKPSLLTMDHLMQAVLAGDSLALEVFAVAGRAVGLVVAGLFNLLNFERVVIGGMTSMAGDALMTPLREEVNRRALPSALVLGRIEMNRLGADGASIGAASYVLQEPVHAH